MLYRNFFFKTITFFGMTAILTSCVNVPSSVPIIGKKNIVRNSLSGKPGSDGPILVVKIDDTSAARPQAGLEDADLVYIEQVEGGLTRLAAIFSSKIPDRVGPVRSARITDIDLLSQFGKVAFAYSGAQKKLLPVIEQANLINLGAQRQSPTIYITDDKRVRPTAMILRANLLFQKLADKSIYPAQSKFSGWKFGTSPETGTPIVDVKISWPANSYLAKWSESEERWLLFNEGVPNLSESGIHLGPTTFVIQIVTITSSEYHDKTGGVTPYSQTIGSGKGYVLRDGKYLDARWNRADPEDGTHWFNSAGKEIEFSPGQVWVALTDKEPIFTKSKEDASLAATK